MSKNEVGPIDILLEYVMNGSTSADDIEMVYTTEDIGNIDEYIKKYAEEKYDWEGKASWNLNKDPDSYQPSKEDIQEEIARIKGPRTEAGKQALKNWIENGKVCILPKKLINCFPFYIDSAQGSKLYESKYNVCQNGKWELAKKWIERVADIYKTPYINEIKRRSKLPDTFTIENFREGLIEMFPEYTEDIKNEIEKQVRKPQPSEEEKKYWRDTQKRIVNFYVKYAREHHGPVIPPQELSDNRDNKYRLQMYYIGLCPNCEDDIVRWFDQLNYERIRKRVEIIDRQKFPEYTEDIKNEIEKQVRKHQLSEEEKKYWRDTQKRIVNFYEEYAKNHHSPAIPPQELSDNRDNKYRLQMYYIGLCPNCKDDIVSWFDQLDYESIRNGVEIIDSQKMPDMNQETR